MLCLKMNSNMSLKYGQCLRAIISPKILPVRELSVLAGERSKMLTCYFSLLVKSVSNTNNPSGSRNLGFKGAKNKRFSCCHCWRPERLRCSDWAILNLCTNGKKAFPWTSLYQLTVCNSFLFFSSILIYELHTSSMLLKMNH